MATPVEAHIEKAANETFSLTTDPEDLHISTPVTVASPVLLATHETQRDVPVPDFPLRYELPPPAFALPVDEANVSEEGGVRRGARQRIPTDYGREYQVQLKYRRLKLASNVWRRLVNDFEILLTDSESVKELKRKRDLLQQSFKEIEVVCDEIRLLDPNVELPRDVEAIQWSHSDLLKRIGARLRELQIETNTRSSTLGSESHASSTRSDRAKKAELETRLRFLNAKTLRQREEFKEELAVVDARLKAVQDIDDEHIQPPNDEMQAAEKVRSYIDSLLDEDQSVPSTQVPFATVTSLPPGGGSRPIPRPRVRTQASTATPITSSTRITTQHQMDPNAPVFQPQVITTSVPMSDTAKVMTELAEHLYVSRIPIPEPPIFSGDSLEYAAWKSAFETLIEQRRIPDVEKIHYLKRYLAGRAKECVEGYFLYTGPNAYREAKAMLDKRFGDVFMLQNAFREKLEKYPRVSSRDGIALRKFADFLRQCLAASRVIPSMSALSDIRENKRLQEKLPEWLVRKWARIIADHKYYGAFPNFETFVNFIVTESDIMCDPCVVSSSMDKPVRSPNKKEKQSLATEGKESKWKPPKKTQRKQDDVSTSKVPISKSDEKKRWPCFMCKKADHHINDCPDFLQMDVKERSNYAFKHALCFGCLNLKHIVANCKIKKTCKQCSLPHPTSLHRDKDQPVSQSSSRTVPKTATSNKAHVLQVGIAETSKTSMVVPVFLSHEDDPQHEIPVYALLDNQSDSTFLLTETCDKLNVSGTPVDLILSTMSTNNENIKTSRVSGLKVRGYKSGEMIRLPSAYVRPSIPTNRKHIPTDETARRWSHLNSIADELTPMIDVEIGLLIGYDCAKALYPVKVIPPVEDGPFALKTELGWSIIGGNSDDDDDDVTCHRVMTSQQTDDAIFVHQTKTKEIISPNDFSRMMDCQFEDQDDTKRSIEDQRFIDILDAGVHQTEDGKFEMPLPFKLSNPQMPNNRVMAEKRLECLRKRLANDVKFKDDYCSFINDMIDRGYAERIDTAPASGKVCYIPHHAVYHNRKKKIRVVMDCSSQYKGTSLNDNLLQGPDMINDLLGILCRFRKESVAVTCDVEKMFFQFKVSEEHRDFLRFLWFEGDISKPAVEYRMCVHLFGAKSSPGCANYGLKKAADSGESEFGKEAADFIRGNFYVDDGLTSVSTPEEAAILIKDTKGMCAQSGIRLHKFASNNPGVMATVPVNDRAEGMRNLDPESDVIERTLGVEWSIGNDAFQFRIVLKDRPPTRRGILSSIGSIYDPLGFLAPVILSGRQILQEICKGKLDWDSTLPDEILSRWESWRDGLCRLVELKVPRCYVPAGFGDIATVQLHHFSDASVAGYGQCSYLRLQDTKGKVHCTLVMAKARVAPVKQVTIPRLELAAAVLSTKISKFLRTALQYENIEEYFWSDSMVVLWYIQNEAKRFHVFVANRVQRIRDSTDPGQWHHVSSENNPADHASRGLTVDQLLHSRMWFHGPDFLWETDVSIGSVEFEDMSENNPEIKRVQSLAVKTEIHDVSRLTDRWNFFSSWKRLCKAVALCLMYKAILLYRVRSCTDPDVDVPARELDVNALLKAEIEIIKSVQRSAFSEEIDALEGPDAAGGYLKKGSPLYRLSPFLDASGVLRVGGRLERATFSTELKHPVILPKKGQVSELLVRHYHSQHHQGRGITINSVREAGFWIIGCKVIVSKVIHDCVTCRKYRGKLQDQVMAPLPTDRLEETPPFTYCAVDYFGPFFIRVKRSDVPRYGALFTCMMTRAVHLEVSDSLETDSFINALRRFIAIRGPIRQLRSDRGTNFVGAKNEFESKIDHDKVRVYLQEKNCDYFTFRMNVPSASHMGGVWERQIRTVRNVLRPILEKSGSQLDDDSLRTLFYEVMSIVNSRPLTVYNLDDPLEEVLTPNHLLTMKTKVVLPPPGTFPATDVYCRKRWKRVQCLLNMFWSRWRLEYLTQLQERQKWNQTRRDMVPGDVVMLKEDNSPRNKWPLGIVEEVYPSDDGHVRKVKVRVADSALNNRGIRQKVQTLLERPVHKCVILIANSGISPPESQQ